MKEKLKTSAAIFLILLILPPLAGGDEVKPTNSREKYYVSFELALGFGVGLFDYTISGARKPLEPGESLGVGVISPRIAIIPHRQLMLGGEFHFMGTGNSVYRQYALMATYFPLQELNAFVKAGYNYGEFDHYVGHDWAGEAEGDGFRIGIGYEMDLRRCFNVGFEISYSGFFAEKGMVHNIIGLVTFYFRV
jgi:hypothetical protein